MYGTREREITKEEYEKCKSGEMSMFKLFDEAMIMGYGALPHNVIERDDKYYVVYSMSDSCD